MKTTKSIIKILIILSLLTAVFFCLFSEPDVDSASWLKSLLFTKALGAACIFAVARLYTRWSKTDTLLSRYDRWSMKGIEK